MLQFGIRATSLTAHEGPEVLQRTTQVAEDRGLDSFWLPDRLVSVEGYLAFLQAQTILEPLTALAFLAASTTRIRLGTAILIAPLRHPLVLAKAAKTLAYLSNSRLILGVGTGWNEREFQAIGIPRSERGVRTDEAIAILKSSFQSDPIRFGGSHYVLDGVHVTPAEVSQPPIWIAGGRGIPEFPDVAAQTFKKTVARRILDADGWLIRPTASPADVREEVNDLTTFAEATQDDLRNKTIAQVNWCHLIEGGDRSKVLQEQEQVFARTLGGQLDFQRARELHFTGTLDDVAEHVRQLVAAGVNHIIASPLTSGTDQVRLWSEIADRVRGESEVLT